MYSNIGRLTKMENEGDFQDKTKVTSGWRDGQKISNFGDFTYGLPYIKGD